jgi:hypothetical protein
MHGRRRGETASTREERGHRGRLDGQGTVPGTGRLRPWRPCVEFYVLVDARFSE